MALTNPINIRLSAEKRFLYEAEAAHKGQSLSVYLRERLEKSEASSQDLQYLREFLENIPKSSSHEHGILLEILLLLRYMAGTEKNCFVRNELNRLKIPVWKIDTLPEKSKHTT